MYWLYSWIRILLFFASYFASRTGLVRPPFVSGIIEEVTAAIGPIVGVPKHFALIGAEHCPKDGPVILCANHTKLDDPLLVYHAARMAGGRLSRIMMRDDYFVGPLWENPIVAAPKLFACMSAHMIDRDRVTLAQMKPFLNVLDEDGSFIIFPGRTRTRSGVFIEYRENFTEPGGVSFFIRQTQKKRPDVRVAAVPIVRTFNPASKRTTSIFGPPLYLEHAADRDAMREFDANVVVAMSRLVEINAAQLVSALLYLRVLHGRAGAVTIDRLADDISRLSPRLEGLHADPALYANLAVEVAAVAGFLARAGMLSLEGQSIQPNAQRILLAPALDTTYRKENPVKYLANQILHFGDVIEGIMDPALR